MAKKRKSVLNMYLKEVYGRRCFVWEWNEMLRKDKVNIP